MKKAKLTHGECWYRRKVQAQDESSLELSLDYTSSCPHRMGREDTMKYYGKKIKEYFDSQLTVKDFNNIDDYFSYFEATRFLNKIQRMEDVQKIRKMAQ